MIKSIFLIVFLLIAPKVSPNVLKFEVSALRKDRASYREVCTFMNKKHLLLISPINMKTLDCMGSVVRIKDYCLKKLPSNANFLRGYLNKKMDEVVCETGKSVYVSIGCDKRDKYLCRRPLNGCKQLKDVYADKLELQHHSFIPKDVDNVLNCYYGLSEKISSSKEDHFLTVNKFDFLRDPVRPSDFKE